ncbi:hypothetical protein [Acetohalobium arabaticum]|uniref:Uncharacterized protein n=1 Tax=Acetohalobium arabaticum (strain ATCC 49924 / DSM 5501 / Z-7288) TaxID=574087 RepID=D9QUS7_ACEAZ|nr:hypothetical protein [Acetohalobium arabaticum]ADL11986.1 hypothetical protein Acear_0440 [Acetohalobium arabaticum DSM 5501]
MGEGELRVFKYNEGDKDELQELIVNKKRELDRKEKALSRIDSKVVNSKLEKSTGLFKALKSFR